MAKRKIVWTQKVWLFGSRAMGNYKQGSDIDIAIVGQEINRSDILQAIDAPLGEVCDFVGLKLVVFDYKSIVSRITTKLKTSPSNKKIS